MKTSCGKIQYSTRKNAWLWAMKWYIQQRKIMVPYRHKACGKYHLAKGTEANFHPPKSVETKEAQNYLKQLLTS